MKLRIRYHDGRGDFLYWDQPSLNELLPGRSVFANSCNGMSRVNLRSFRVTIDELEQGDSHLCQTQNAPSEEEAFYVLRTGLEPVTYGLEIRCLLSYIRL